jgi:hypothetical protein
VSGDEWQWGEKMNKWMLAMKKGRTAWKLPVAPAADSHLSNQHTNNYILKGYVKKHM